MIIPRRVTLPYPSFLAAWLALGLGEVPTPLLPARPVPTAGRTLDEVIDLAWADLFERELAIGRRLDEGLAGTLRVLAGSATRYYAFFHTGDGDTRSVLVAGSSVVATAGGETMTLRPTRSRAGAEVIVDTLPKVPKAPGDALSAPAGELSRASGAGILAKVRLTGQATVPIRMRWLLARPRTGGGQVYAARRCPDGRYLVCARPVSYIETEVGRVIATEHLAGDGTTWRSLIPADAATLRKRVSEMMAGVTD